MTAARWPALAVMAPGGEIPNRGPSRGSSGRLAAGLFVVEQSRGYF